MSAEPMATDQSQDRLHPSRLSARFYILTVLRTQIEQIASAHVSRKNGAVLVDLGCGSMPYRPIFEPYLSRYIGVDLPGKATTQGSVGPDGRMPLPDQCADIVLSTQVLEHVEQPEAYLQECRRLLKPEGLFILSTHGYWMFHPDPQDLWRWTGQGLQRIIEEMKFDIIQFEGLAGLAATGLQLFQDGLWPRVPGLVKPWFAGGIQMLMSLVDKLSSPAQRRQDACVFILVAQKKGVHE